MFPLAFFLVLITNICQIRLALQSIPDSSYENYKTLLKWLVLFYRNCSTQDLLYNVAMAGSFLIPPLIVSFLLSWWLYFSWERTLISPEPIGWFSKLLHYIFVWPFSKIVTTSILNHMGQITAFDKDCEILMLDILADDEYLYSGVYSDYSMEDSKLHMISLKNIIRYKSFYDNTTGTKTYTERYLLPNQGEVFFLVDNIKNFHIWKIHESDVYEIDLEKKFSDGTLDKSDNSIIFAVWLMSIQWVSDVKFGIKILKPSDKNKTQNLLNKLKKLKIPRREIQATFARK